MPKQLPFTQEAFDVVLSGFGIGHFAEPDRAFAEFRRVLPGGPPCRGLVGASLAIAHQRPFFRGPSGERIAFAAQPARRTERLPVL